jgi:hypothetical protein
MTLLNVTDLLIEDWPLAEYALRYYPLIGWVRGTVEGAMAERLYEEGKITRDGKYFKTDTPRRYRRDTNYEG